MVAVQKSAIPPHIIASDYRKIGPPLRPAAGSVPHFIGVLLGQAGGVELKHVAYRGTLATS